jgi:hypothetical protein
MPVEVDLGISAAAGGTLEASGPGIVVLETSTGAAGGAGVAAGVGGGGTASKVGGILGLDSLFGSESTDILVLADASGASTGLGTSIGLAGAADTSIGFSASTGAAGIGVAVGGGTTRGAVEDKTGD